MTILCRSGATTMSNDLELWSPFLLTSLNGLDTAREEEHDQCTTRGATTARRDEAKGLS